jgi:DNA-binding transcriptional LysR family regulator
VSRQITQLERELGVFLLVRTTRKVAPSKAGQVFYMRCRKILALADQAFAEMSRMKIALQ